MKRFAALSAEWVFAQAVITLQLPFKKLLSFAVMRNSFVAIVYLVLSKGKLQLLPSNK